MLRRNGSIVLGIVLGAFAVAHCVGDDNKQTEDAGNDVTTSDVVSPQDVVQPIDTGTDASSVLHVYAASFGNPFQPALVVFDQPLSNSSQPSAVVTTGFKGPADVELFKANGTTQLLVVDAFAQKIFIFDLPIKTTSTPSATIALPFAGFDSAFDSKGNLWVSGSNGTTGMGARYAPPLVDGEQPAQTFTIPNATLGSFAVGVNKFDGLFVGSTATNQTGHVYGEATPFDAGALAATVDNTHVDTPTGIAFSNTAVFVSDQVHGIVDEFTAPITSTTVPTAVGVNALSAPTRMAFNANGDLVVADGTKGLVILQGPTFDTALVTVPNQTGDAASTNFSFRSVAFGP